MKRFLSLVLVLMLMLSVFSAVTVLADTAEECVAYDYITLSGNTTMYKNTVREAEELIVYAVKDGVQTEITGSAYLTYSSDNPLTFDFVEGTNKLESKDEFGMATVTAEYTKPDGSKLSASVIFQRTSVGVAYTATTTAYDFPGHIKGSTSSHSWNNGTTNGNWSLRAYTGSNDNGTDWKTSKYRTLTGWFYDDGTTTRACYFSWFFKWHGDGVKAATFSTNGTIGLGSATATQYTPSVLNAVKRTKGWHQVVVAVDKSGYIRQYIDGVFVGKTAINLGSLSDAEVTKKTSYLELRGVDTTLENDGIYDDLAISEYTDIKPEYGVSVYATGCAVAHGNTNISYPSCNGALKVARGESVTLKLKPFEGYINPSVKIRDYAGLNTKTLDVVDNTVTFTPENDVDVVVEYQLDPEAVEITKTVYEDDFTADPEKPDRTKKGAVFTKGADAVVNWDGEAGVVRYKGGSAGGNHRMYYKKADGKTIHEIKPGRTYTYTHTISVDSAAQLYYQVNLTKPRADGVTYQTAPTSTKLTTSTKTVTGKYSIVFKDTDVGEARSFDIINYSSVATMTYDNIKVEETTYGYPVKVSATEGGKVTSGGKEVSGDVPFEIGEAGFTLTPDSGYEISSVTYGGIPVVVSDKAGCDVTVNVASAETLEVTFAEKVKTLPSVAAGTGAVEKNYSETIGGVDVVSENSIMMYATIDAGYGYSVIGGGYKVAKVGTNDGKPVILPAIMQVYAGQYAIRAVGPALTAGTYTITPYVTVTGQGEVEGTPKTITIE